MAEALSDHSTASIVKEYAEKAGYKPEEFGGRDFVHSGRFARELPP